MYLWGILVLKIKENKLFCHNFVIDFNENYEEAKNRYSKIIHYFYDKRKEIVLNNDDVFGLTASVILDFSNGLVIYCIPDYTLLTKNDLDIKTREEVSGIFITTMVNNIKEKYDVMPCSDNINFDYKEVVWEIEGIKIKVFFDRKTGLFKVFLSNV